jgi:hypothetical protein
LPNSNGNQMSSTITLTGNENLVIISGNVSSFSKVDRSSSYQIRMVMRDDIKFVSYSDIAIRDSDFQLVIDTITGNVTPPQTPLPPFLIGVGS